MADQVSRMAIGGFSVSFMRLLMNFLAWCPGRPVVSRMNGTRLTCGYRSNLAFSALLAMCPGRVLAAATRGHNSNIEIRVRAVVIEKQDPCALVALANLPHE